MFFNILVLLTSVLCLVYCAPRWNNVSSNCGENEVYIRCKSACKPRICEQNKVQQCDDTVKCQPGCECIDDFLRNNKNVCVPKEFCSTDYFKSIPIEYFDQVSGEEFILEDTNDDQTTGRNSNHSEESNTELVPNAYMAKASNKIAPNENSDIDYYYYEQQTEDEDLDFNRKYSKPLEQNKNKYLSSIDNNNAKMERSNNYIWSTPPFSKFTENEQATEETTEMQYIQMVEDNMERNLVSKLTTNQRQDEIATEQVQQVTATSKSKSEEIENNEWESKLPDSNSNLDNDQITNSPQPDDSRFDQHIEGTYQTVTESSATEDVSDIKSTSGRQPDDSRFDQHIEGTYQTVTESSATEDVSDIKSTSGRQPDDSRFDQHIEGTYQTVTESSATEDVSDIKSTSGRQPDDSRFDQHIEGTYQTVTESSATEDVSDIKSTSGRQPDDSRFDQHIEGTYQTVTESSATEDVSDIKSTSGRQPDDSRFGQHIEGTYQTVTESSAAEDVSDINETSDPQPDDPRFDQHIEGKYQFVTSSSAREDVSDINSTSRPQPDGSRFDQHIEGTYQTVTESSATEDVSEGTEDETSGQSPGVWSESKYEKKTFNKTSDSKHIASERPNLWSETTPSFTYITVVPDNKDNSEFHQNNEDLHRKVTEETTDETQIFWFDESPSNRYYPNTTPKKSHDEKDSIIPVKIDQNNFIFNNWGALDPPPKWRGRYHESGRNEKKVDHRHEYGRRPIYKDAMRGHHTPEYERRPIYKDEMRGHHTPEYERRPIYNDKKRDPYNDGSPSCNHRPEYRHRPINRRHSFKCTRRSGERTRCRVIRPKHWKPKYNKNHRSHVRPVHVCKRRHNGKLLCYWRRLYQKVRSHH